MQRLDKRLFDEALQALEEMGCIETLTQLHPSGGRPATSIHITEKGRKEKPHD
jgi:DNA-binding PadR family transcriptional regulator